MNEAEVREEPNGEGDCYEVALLTFRKMPPEVRANSRLCHGRAIGTGGNALGLDYGHAWVERLIWGALFVIDQSNGHDYFGPAVMYYMDGQIHDVQCYTYAEMAAQIVKHGTYGPWPEGG